MIFELLKVRLMKVGLLIIYVGKMVSCKRIDLL